MKKELTNQTTFYMWFNTRADDVTKAFSQPFSENAKQKYVNDSDIAAYEKMGYKLIKMTSDQPITIKD